MFVVSNLVFALAHIVQMLLWLVIILLLIRVVVSWLPPQQLFRYRRFITIVNRMTEWFLKPLRRRLPLVYGGFDMTPLVILLLVYFLELFLVRSLFQLAARLAISS